VESTPVSWIPTRRVVTRHQIYRGAFDIPGIRVSQTGAWLGRSKRIMDFQRLRIVDCG
jgi:hypothetical protein